MYVGSGPSSNVSATCGVPVLRRAPNGPPFSAAIGGRPGPTMGRAIGTAAPGSGCRAAACRTGARPPSGTGLGVGDAVGAAAAGGAWLIEAASGLPSDSERVGVACPRAYELPMIAVITMAHTPSTRTVGEMRINDTAPAQRQLRPPVPPPPPSPPPSQE